MYTDLIIKRASTILQNKGITLKGSETLDEIEDLIKSHTSPREYDDFIWNLQLEILDDNGSPCYQAPTI